MMVVRYRFMVRTTLVLGIGDEELFIQVLVLVITGRSHPLSMVYCLTTASNIIRYQLQLHLLLHLYFITKVLPNFPFRKQLDICLFGCAYLSTLDYLGEPGVF